MRLHLGSAGFDVTEPADWARAVTIGRTARFEVIVLDVRLPTLDGIAVCRALRAHGPNVDTPILMLIAAEGESDTVATLETGADDYITKPFGIGTRTRGANQCTLATTESDSSNLAEPNQCD